VFSEPMLDEARVPAGPLLLAEVSRKPWLAASMSTLEVIDDPFKPARVRASTTNDPADSTE
jgi:hypothetical protein